MLTRISIKGFRSFSQDSFQHIDLSRFTVIVGENDSGKSNVLRALSFVFQTDPRTIEREDFHIRLSKSNSKSGGISSKKSIAIEIRLVFSSSKKLLPREFQKAGYKTNTDSSFEIICKASGESVDSYKKEYFLNKKPVKKQESVKRLLSKIKFNVTPSIRDVDFLKTLRDLLPVTRSSTIRLAVADVREKIKSKFKNPESLFKSSTRVEKAEIDPLLDVEDVLKMIELDFVITQDGIPVHLKNHGQGMVSRIIISLILKRGRGYIIGIEEPEIHMHPNMIREIVEECNNLKKSTQILLVTHSHYLINFVRIDQILLARKEKKLTKVHKIVPSDAALAKKVENDIFLNRLKTEILFARGVIFVEGAYDKKIFWQQDESINNKALLKGITIVDVGNCDFAAQIALCVQASIPWAIIADNTAFLKSNNAKFSDIEFVSGRTIDNLILAMNSDGLLSSSNQNSIESLNNLLKEKELYLRINTKLNFSLLPTRVIALIDGLKMGKHYSSSDIMYLNRILLQNLYPNESPQSMNLEPTKGLLVTALEKYVPKDVLQKFENKLRDVRRRDKASTQEINKNLRAVKGSVFRLTGDDISDSIINALRLQNDDTLYQKIFQHLGGHQSVTNSIIIRKEVEQSILSKDAKMLEVARFLPSDNEISVVFNKAMQNIAY